MMIFHTVLMGAPFAPMAAYCTGASYLGRITLKRDHFETVDAKYLDMILPPKK